MKYRDKLRYEEDREETIRMMDEVIRSAFGEDRIESTEVVRGDYKDELVYEIDLPYRNDSVELNVDSPADTELRAWSEEDDSDWLKVYAQDIEKALDQDPSL